MLALVMVLLPFRRGTQAWAMAPRWANCVPI
jgi:hypothetical protein